MIQAPGYVAIMNALLCPIKFNINLLSISNKFQFKEFGGAVKTTYAFSAFLMPFPSNFRFAWYQQAGEGGSYDTLAERYGERIRCFTLAPGSISYFIQDQKAKMNETETEVKNYSIADTYNNATHSA
jgi:hypothetical protein